MEKNGGRIVYFYSCEIKLFKLSMYKNLCLWQNRHLKGLLLTIFRSISRWSAGFTSPTKRVYSFLANLEINETVCYVLFIMFITGNASHYINMKLTTDHMPNIPLKGIIAPHCTTLIHLQGLLHEYKQWRP